MDQWQKPVQRSMQLTLRQEGGQRPSSPVFSKLCVTKMNLVSANYLDLFQHAREERKETRGKGERNNGKEGCELQSG